MTGFSFACCEGCLCTCVAKLVSDSKLPSCLADSDTSMQHCSSVYVSTYSSLHLQLQWLYRSTLMISSSLLNKLLSPFPPSFSHSLLSTSHQCPSQSRWNWLWSSPALPPHSSAPLVGYDHPQWTPVPTLLPDNTLLFNCWKPGFPGLRLLWEHHMTPCLFPCGFFFCVAVSGAYLAPSRSLVALIE